MFIRFQNHIDALFQVTTDSGKRIMSSHLISALPLPALHSLLKDSGSESISQAGSGSSEPLKPLPHLLSHPASSVTVVNMVFPPSSTPIHPQGFGYLIPRPAAGYASASGHVKGMLGTVFDSCALSEQDTLLTDGKPFTKLTVMLGGPYGAPSPPPSSPEFVPRLLDALQAHVGRVEPLPKPSLVRIHEHRDCIPTPTVGHVARMHQLQEAVHERWGPNAQVIGAGVGGVSVGDCVESGRRAARSL